MITLNVEVGGDVLGTNIHFSYQIEKGTLVACFLSLRQYEYERDEKLSQGLHNFSIPKKEKEKMT